MSFKRVLASVLLATGLAMAQAQSVTLKWGAQNDVLTLDPHSQIHATTLTILMHSYEGLTRYSQTYEVEPALATKWTYVTPTQVRFDLRRGVKFYDGTPFTADDVVFSFTRIKHPNGFMQIFVGGISEIRKIDDYTVDVILTAPNPTLLRSLVDFRIMSKAWTEKNRSVNVQDFKAKEENYASRNVNGTGAYQITGWQPEQKITMTVNKNWWDKNSGNVTDVVYSPIKSDQTRIAALLSGELDMVTDLPTQDVSRLRGDARLKVVDGNEIRTIFLGMDLFSDELKHSDVKGKNPLKDRRVREALNVAIDREAIRRSTMNGLSLPTSIMVAPGVNGNTPDLDQPVKADPDRSRRLLAEAGYPNGFEIQLNCPNNRYVKDEEICQNIAVMWTRIGVKTRLVAESMATFVPKLQSYDASIYMLGWGVSTLDAQNTLQSLIRTRVQGGADGNSNFGRASDPVVDRLVDAMKTEIDVGKRNAMIREALIRTRDEVLVIPLHHQLRPWAMKAGVTTVYRVDDRPEARFTTIK
jgi:peptide/nickel transport system substrate-binding protein